MMSSKPVRIKRVDLKKLSPEERHRINTVLSGCPNATVFHTIEWNSLLTKEFGLRNVTLLATIGEEPAGLYSLYVLPGHLCRSSAIHLESAYGGPVSVGGDARVVSELLNEAERLQKAASFQIWTPSNYDISPFVRAGYSSREMYTSVLNLQQPEEELWTGLKRNKRREIRNAVRNEVSAVEGDVSLVDEYYGMVLSTLGRAGIDVPPKSFYRRVVGQLAPQGMAKFLLAKHNGKLIAGVIVLPYKDTLYGWHMASYKAHWSVSPNDFLQWELLRWARQKGYRRYDLLRVQPDLLPGIAAWKTAFGGDTVSCYYLQKATAGHRLWRGLRLLTSPRRLVSKLRSLAGYHDAD